MERNSLGAFLKAKGGHGGRDIRFLVMISVDHQLTENFASGSAPPLRKAMKHNGFAQQSRGVAPSCDI